MKKLTIYIGEYEQTKNTIDANLSPSKQCEKLYEYLKYHIENNLDIIIYTNSPYIINKLTNLQGYFTHNVKCEYFNHELSHEFNAFEVLNDGSMKTIEKYKEMISDENLLNDSLGDSNDEFSKILDMQDYNENLANAIDKTVEIIKNITETPSNICLNTLNDRLLYDDDKSMVESILPIYGRNIELLVTLPYDSKFGDIFSYFGYGALCHHKKTNSLFVVSKQYDDIDGFIENGVVKYPIEECSKVIATNIIEHRKHNVNMLTTHTILKLVTHLNKDTQSFTPTVKFYLPKNNSYKFVLNNPSNEVEVNF